MQYSLARAARSARRERSRATSAVLVMAATAIVAAAATPIYSWVGESHRSPHSEGSGWLASIHRCAFLAIQYPHLMACNPSMRASRCRGATTPRAATENDADVPDKDILARCWAMRIKELRTELGTRGIPWADALEKDELVQRLAAVLSKEAAYCSTGRVRPGAVAQLTGPELDKELAYPSTPILLDVFATWCGPCKMMAPQMESAARTLGSTVRLVKVDSDQEPEIATRLHVGGLPTLILFNRDGVEVARQEGAVMEQQILDMVKAAGV